MDGARGANAARLAGMLRVRFLGIVDEEVAEMIREGVTPWVLIVWDE